MTVSFYPEALSAMLGLDITGHVDEIDAVGGPPAVEKMQVIMRRYWLLPVSPT